MSTSTPTLTPTSETETSYWTPLPGSTFQIQLADYPPDNTEIDVEIYELDLFETPLNTINYLHNNGNKVICYFNAGAWEIFRPDADDFPDEVISNRYIGWPGERWLDVRHFKLFSEIIIARMDLALEKGYDAVDPDNINGYQENTGFDISAQDQIIYNIWLSEQAHARGLSIGLKNNSAQVAELINHYDFAVLEDCAVFDKCIFFLPFIEKNKAVFQIEYTDQMETIHNFCQDSTMNGYTGILKHRELDAFAQLCDQLE